jgi:hypothetical protein
MASETQVLAFGRSSLIARISNRECAIRILGNSNKTTVGFESNRERIALVAAFQQAPPCRIPSARRKVQNEKGKNDTVYGRECELKFTAVSDLLLTLRGNGIRWNRSAATAAAAAPATSTRSAGASGSAAAALPATTASSSTAAGTRACIPATARTTPATRRGRARSYATCRRVHAVRVCFAKGINRRKNYQRNHRRQQRVLGCILSRFLPPDSFEECFHNDVVDSEKTRTVCPTNCLHSFIALF